MGCRQTNRQTETIPDLNTNRQSNTQSQQNLWYSQQALASMLMYFKLPKRLVNSDGFVTQRSAVVLLDERGRGTYGWSEWSTLGSRDTSKAESAGEMSVRGCAWVEVEWGVESDGRGEGCKRRW